MANYQEYMHPYSEPGLASNPPVLDASAYPNSALKSPYPVQSKRNPLATANFPLLKKLAATCLNLTEVFEPAVGGGPPLNIMQLHSRRKYKKEVTSVRQEDGTDVLVHRPALRSDLIGGTKDIELFWALMSIIIDLIIEHISHQIVTGTPFSPEGETEVFLSKITSKTKFKLYFTAASNTDIMEYFAQSVFAGLGGLDGNCPAASTLWDYSASSIFENCISAWVGCQVYLFLVIFLADFESHISKIVMRVVLTEETCGIVPPLGLCSNDTTLPFQKMTFALQVLERIRFHRAGSEVTAEEMDQEIIYLQSSSLFTVTKGIFKKLGLPPISYMLRKELLSFRIPFETFAIAAMLIEREFFTLAHLAENFDMRMSDPETVGVYSMADLLKWSHHTGLIELAVKSSPSTSSASPSTSSALLSPASILTVSPAMAALITLRSKLEEVCQLQRVAADRGQWS